MRLVTSIYVLRVMRRDRQVGQFEYSEKVYAAATVNLSEWLGFLGRKTVVVA
jgi:hypothetical protein